MDLLNIDCADLGTRGHVGWTSTHGPISALHDVAIATSL